MKKSGYSARKQVKTAILFLCFSLIGTFQAGATVPIQNTTTAQPTVPVNESIVLSLGGTAQLSGNQLVDSPSTQDPSGMPDRATLRFTRSRNGSLLVRLVIPNRELRGKGTATFEMNGQAVTAKGRCSNKRCSFTAVLSPAASEATLRISVQDADSRAQTKPISLRFPDNPQSQSFRRGRSLPTNFFDPGPLSTSQTANTGPTADYPFGCSNCLIERTNTSIITATAPGSRNIRAEMTVYSANSFNDGDITPQAYVLTIRYFDAASNQFLGANPDRASQVDDFDLTSRPPVTLDGNYIYSSGEENRVTLMRLSENPAERTSISIGVIPPNRDGWGILGSQAVDVRIEGITVISSDNVIVRLSHRVPIEERERPFYSAPAGSQLLGGLPQFKNIIAQDILFNRNMTQELNRAVVSQQGLILVKDPLMPNTYFYTMTVISQIYVNVQDPGYSPSRLDLSPVWTPQYSYWYSFQEVKGSTQNGYARYVYGFKLDPSAHSIQELVIYNRPEGKYLSIVLPAALNQTDSMGRLIGGTRPFAFELTPQGNLKIYTSYSYYPNQFYVFEYSFAQAVQQSRNNYYLYPGNPYWQTISPNAPWNPNWNSVQWTG